MKKISIFLALIIIAISCKSKSEAVQYNEAIVAAFADFSKELSSEMQVVRTSEDSLTKIEALNKLEKAADNALGKIEKLKTPTEATEYQNTVVGMIRNVRDTYIPANKDLLSIVSDSLRSEDYNSIAIKINEIATNIQGEISKAKELQKNFAEAIDSKLK
ncbi:MAG TPA: hypothetical protein PKX92_10935 [Edaphocola sp.]|nr:hypothetical protein [Edaphocola sp.]